MDLMNGDGIIATVPIRIGRPGFPPLSACRMVCKWDAWVVDRFPWPAYEVWFRGVKAPPPCVS